MFCFNCGTQLPDRSKFCPKCKKETLIDVQQQKTTIIKEPDAKTQSR